MNWTPEQLEQQAFTILDGYAKKFPSDAVKLPPHHDLQQFFEARAFARDMIEAGFPVYRIDDVQIKRVAYARRWEYEVQIRIVDVASLIVSGYSSFALRVSIYDTDFAEELWPGYARWIAAQTANLAIERAQIYKRCEAVSPDTREQCVRFAEPGDRGCYEHDGGVW